MSYEPSCRGYGDMEVRSGAEGTETGARRPFMYAVAIP